MATHRFAPGVRLSPLDVLVLIGGASAAAALAWFVPWLAFVVGFVVGHFFLFCNVFRISRRLELAWSALFVGLAAATVRFGQPGWLITAITSLVGTFLVVALEMQKPSYHGIAWKWINPNLRQWWEANKSLGGTPGP